MTDSTDHGGPFPPYTFPLSKVQQRKADRLGAIDCYHSFGHPTYNTRREGRLPAGWRYLDTQELVADSPGRACAACNQFRTSDGMDPCLGKLPGVWSACCGHGFPEVAFVVFNDDTEFRGVADLPKPEALLKILRRLEKQAARAPLPEPAELIKRRATESLLAQGWSPSDIAGRVTDAGRPWLADA
ncbi:hypothetical protein [Brevundimonas sp. TWP2-3-4b1]|uniref:hypothetical protein n=1 Tax=Brevundimonas sp. TWP2-3-4b1 TaxID=2804580 RepID=UPI003CF60D45